MGVVIHDVEGKARYKIEPYKDTCFQVHKWVDAYAATRTNAHYKEGDIIPEGWRALECYPSNLSYAIKLCYDKLIQDGLKPERGLKQSRKFVEDTANAVLSGARLIVDNLGGDKPNSK